MNISGLRPRLAALLIAILTCASLLSLSTISAWAASGTVTEFPAGGSFGITAGPDGNLWFTDEGNKIGRITTTGTVTEFPIPTASSRPFGITAGPDGNVWFTESGTGNIGRITPAGVITEFPAHSGEGITVGPDGNLWFTEVSGGKIGRITTS